MKPYLPRKMRLLFGALGAMLVGRGPMPSDAAIREACLLRYRSGPALPRRALRTQEAAHVR